jgi:hypothetical protein
MNRDCFALSAGSTVADISALIGALELGGVNRCDHDDALEQTTITGPSVPTAFRAHCYAGESDLSRCIDDGALEQTLIAGPNQPTSLLANCYATKSALCPRIDGGEPLAQA